MPLVPSMVWKGKRSRAIWNRLYHRPINETFHEFLVFVVQATFGEEWRKAQVRLSEERRHAVIRWCSAWADHARTSEYKLEADGITKSSPATGPTAALLQLGYDLFILQTKNRLPDFLIERLRNQREFQGARYEVAVAAIIARSGFEIEFLDDKNATEKHCELIATHADSGLRFGVEAKSRRRRGVLNEKGVFEYSGDARGIKDLLSSAKKQKPDGLPFLIFIDVNLPPDSREDTPLDDKQMWKDVKRMMEQTGGCAPDRPDPFAALFVTNFAPHYGWADGSGYKGDWLMAWPQYSQHPLPKPLLERIYAMAGRYDQIPDEV